MRQPAVSVAQPEHASTLTCEELRDIIDSALWAGQLLLQFGAEPRRVEDAEFRTRMRRVRRFGVNTKWQFSREYAWGTIEA